MFAGDPALFAAAIPDWWLCPDCRSVLLGDQLAVHVAPR
jgi:rubredoxin